MAMLGHTFQDDIAEADRLVIQDFGKYPTYSTDLSTYDSYIFKHLDIFLRQKVFRSNEDTQTDFLAPKLLGFFRKA